jgi:DNA-binding NarL/FixJ family response regulator
VTLVPTRVVLVDDVADVRRMVRISLRLHGGFEVVGEAGDGAEAVRLVVAERPDILVLDLGLPDIAGRDVLTQVREQSPGTRIVVFSGAAEVADRDWVTERVEGFVLKDGNVDYLVELLQEVGEQGAHAVLDLPRDLASVREARQFLRRTLTAWDLADVEDTSQLVVSELVTNAVTHADSACRVRLLRHPSTLRIEVSDCGAGTPDPQPANPGGEHGRGIHIVSALSVAWGTEPLADGGKVVWAELPLVA